MIQATYPYGLPKEVTSSSLVYTGPGTLSAVIVASHSSGTIKFWDNTSAATTVLVNTFTFPTGSGVYNFGGAKFNVGLFATIGGTIDCTVLYNPFNG